MDKTSVSWRVIDRLRTNGQYIVIKTAVVDQLENSEQGYTHYVHPTIECISFLNRPQMICASYCWTYAPTAYETRSALDGDDSG